MTTHRNIPSPTSRATFAPAVLADGVVRVLRDVLVVVNLVVVVLITPTRCGTSA